MAAADVDALPTFGAELKDGFKPANVWVANGVVWLDEIQQFYRERSAIEKEYSAKLNALAKRYFEKKVKRSASLSVGDTPSMTPGSLESASLTTWTTQLNTLESRADEHERYGNELVSRVAEPLKYLSTKLEELRKRHVDHGDRLEKERDASYAELRKTKAKYDGVCQEVEARRKKAESAFDKAKAQSQYQQQILDMNNVKNTYIIAINVTNKQKEKYYHEYVPELLDSLQDLSEFRTIKLNALWTLAAQLEAGMLQASRALVDNMAQEITRNQPHLDSMMYIRHNLGAWVEPADKVFEPSPVWHDDDVMMVDEAAKVYLRNVLNKSKSQLGDLRREVDKKRREVEGVKRLKQRIRDGAEKNDEVEVVRQMFALQEELHQTERARITAEVETSTITAAVGDVTLGAKNHNFKSQTFKIPTNCDLCGERIWGLSAKGFDCRDCGYTCHSKCEMKVPAECPGEQSKEERKRLKAERQEAANALLAPSTSLPDHIAELPDLSRTNTMSSLSARRSIAGASSLASPRSPADDYHHHHSPAISPGITEAPPSSAAPPLPSMSAPTAPGARPPARKNRVIAPPPSAYISELPGSAPPNGGGSGGGGGAPATPRSAEQKGRMLYAFEASGEGELTVPEGRDVVLLEHDTTNSGWIRVRAGYKEGMVPSSYVELDPEPTAPPASLVPHHTGASGRPSSTYSTNSGSSSIGTGVSTSASVGAKKKGPAVAPRRGAKKLRYVEAVYDYAAQSDAEHTMAEGERFVLIKEDPGDGWAEVEKGGVTRSVPASYIQMV